MIYLQLQESGILSMRHMALTPRMTPTGMRCVHTNFMISHLFKIKKNDLDVAIPQILLGLALNPSWLNKLKSVQFPTNDTNCKDPI